MLSAKYNSNSRTSNELKIHLAFTSVLIKVHSMEDTACGWWWKIANTDLHQTFLRDLCNPHISSITEYRITE